MGAILFSRKDDPIFRIEVTMPTFFREQHFRGQLSRAIKLIFQINLSHPVAHGRSMAL